MTCVVHFFAILDAQLHEGCHASVDRSGALIVMREAQESYPGGDFRMVARTVAIYAPGAWSRVTMEEA